MGFLLPSERRPTIVREPSKRHQDRISDTRASATPPASLDYLRGYRSSWIELARRATVMMIAIPSRISSQSLSTLHVLSAFIKQIFF